MTKEVVAIEIRLSDETSFLRLTRRKICPQCGFILPYSPDNERITQCPECSQVLEVRSDDNPDTAKKRIEEQGNIALRPILDYYQQLGILAVVNGEVGIAEVDKEIEKILVG